MTAVPNRPNRFPTTHWTLIQKSRGKGHQEALEELCTIYWPPLYWFLRGQGYEAEEARDLVQGYFAALLEKDYVGDFDPERGRFRTFMIRSIKNFTSKQKDRNFALKRGGGRIMESLDSNFDGVELALQRALSHDSTPESLFERSWAETVLHESRQRLRDQYEKAGRLSAFEVLEASIDAHQDDPGADDLATQLNLARHSVKVTVHRFRRRFRGLVREVLAETVADEEALEEEIRHFIQVLGRPL